MPSDETDIRRRLLTVLNERLKSLHENQPKNGREEKSKNEQDAIKMGSPVRTAPPNPPPSETGERQKRDACKTYKATIKVLKEPLEIAAIVGGLIVAILIYLQYREMISATSLTRKSVETSQGQMAIMKRQLDDSEAQQRALLKFGQIIATISAVHYIPYPIGLVYVGH